jgi:hypothetical protein
MYFHYKIPDREALEVFAMDDDFLISFNDFAKDIGQRPYLGTSVGEKPYILPSPEREALVALLDGMKRQAGFAPQAALGIVDKIKAWWGHIKFF